MNRPYTEEELNDQELKDEEYAQMIALKPKGFYLHKPKYRPLLFQIFETRLAALQFFYSDINYFALRHRMPESAKRDTDMAFILHYVLDHRKKDNPPSFSEEFRFWSLWARGYCRELSFSYLPLENKKRKTKKEKEFLKIYDQRRFFLYFWLRDEEDLGYFHDAGLKISRTPAT